MFWRKDERSAGGGSELILGGPGHRIARINGKAACRRCPYLYRYRSIVSGALVKILNPARVSSRFFPSPLPSPIEMSEGGVAHPRLQPAQSPEHKQQPDAKRSGCADHYPERSGKILSRYGA